MRLTNNQNMRRLPASFCPRSALAAVLVARHESGCFQFHSSLQSRAAIEGRREVASRQSHNLEVAGSSPAVPTLRTNTIREEVAPRCAFGRGRTNDETAQAFDWIAGRDRQAGWPDWTSGDLPNQVGQPSRTLFYGSSIPAVFPGVCRDCGGFLFS